jgi:GH15 family glucan-1,4-alpha-glucosidase
MKTRLDLVSTSIRLLREAQHPTGAFAAAPRYPTYRFCWFRDASYVAHALDRFGAREPAARFHRWAERVVLAHAQSIETAIAAPPGSAARRSGVRARYPLDGEPADDDWPNFQLDGIATWLTVRLDHLRRGGKPIAGESERATSLVARYLAALWDEPNFDAWEEAGDRRHPSTWGAILGALESYAEATDDAAAGEAAGSVRAALLTRGVRGGSFTKHEGADAVDANLLFLAVPRAAIPLNAAVFQRTLSRIETDLVDAGAHRYRGDSFYGGGEWVVLSGFLGWCYARLGRHDDARACLEWMGAQADDHGNLPEQVATHLYAPGMLPVWERRWGPVATPLLWSHAMYLILADELGERAG